MFNIILILKLLLVSQENDKNEIWRVFGYQTKEKKLSHLKVREINNFNNINIA